MPVVGLRDEPLALLAVFGALVRMSLVWPHARAQQGTHLIFWVDDGGRF